MTKLTKPKGKIVRRFGINIFENPKYTSLLQRRPFRASPRRRTQLSQYAKQLIEKQKLKNHYGLTEKQMLNTFKEARRSPGETGEVLLTMLERRLDNVVFCLGMASTRSQARQIVNHGHIRVDGRTVNLPSYCINSGESISVYPRKKSHDLLSKAMSKNPDRQVPKWLSLSKSEMTANVLRLPSRDEIPIIADEKLVVEFYSR